MFDIGWTEMVVVAIVALVAIGPKELPAILKTVGGWIARARSMAREFQSGVDEILREAEVEKYRQKAQDLALLHPETALRSMLDPKDQLRSLGADPLATDPFATDPLATGDPDDKKAHAGEPAPDAGH